MIAEYTDYTITRSSVRVEQAFRPAFSIDDVNPASAAEDECLKPRELKPIPFAVNAGLKPCATKLAVDSAASITAITAIPAIPANIVSAFHENY